MKKIFFGMVLVFLAACGSKKDIDEILQNKYEAITLSADFESSSVNLKKNHFKEILVLLHNNFFSEKIRDHFNISDSAYRLLINELFGEGLIKKNDNGDFVAACMVIDRNEANALKKTADSLGQEMSGIAIDRFLKIKNAYLKIASFKNISFEDASLFILSNVLHNYWQMKFIEEKFIKASPPKRGISRYYLAILEKNKNDNGNPFGLFVSNFQNTGKYIYCNYGSELKPMPSKKNIDEIIKNKRSNFPVIGRKDYKKLESLASIITQDLLNYLERNRTLFIKMYLNSVYKEQTSFREWFMWFYQFMITKTTNTLVEKGFIKKQSFDNAFYILVE